MFTKPPEAGIWKFNWKTFLNKLESMGYHNVLFVALLAACSSGPKEHFVLRGTVPGATDSTTVSLAPVNDPAAKIQGYVVDGKFELQGKVDAPTYCVLNLVYSGPKDKYRARNAKFFVENGDLTFETAHVDSLAIPERYVIHDLRKEANFKVTGSASQDVYYPYQQRVAPLHHAIDVLSARFRMTKDMGVYRQLRESRDELEKVSREFVQNNHDLSANLQVAEALKREPFMYDQAYLDELERMFSSYQDTCAPLRDFRQYLQDAKAFVRGLKLQDAEVTTPEGKKVNLSDVISKDGYTVLDFWASWCGPCRASFPHMRNMYKKYGDKVKFVSISVDSKVEAWKQAMDEEKLPWTEVLSSEKLNKDKRELYGSGFVPTLLLIDPEGRIVFFSDNTGALELELESIEEQL